MKIIGGDRQTGKTTKAIEYCLKHNYTLVVLNSSLKKIILDKHPTLKIITHLEFLKNEDENEEYVIDDLEIFLGKNVKMITATSEIENLKINFNSLDSLIDIYFSLGKETFNEEYPNWRFE